MAAIHNHEVTNEDVVPTKYLTQDYLAPGLASLMGSLAAESAGTRDSIALADALARIGGRLDVQPGADATTITISTLTRHARAALDLMADIVRRPQFTAADFARVRELRLSRLRQMSRVASTIAAIE